MKNIVIIIFALLLFKGAFCQPDTLNYEAGKLLVKLKKPLPETNIVEFEKALKLNKKDKELKEFIGLKKAFKSDDENLKRIYELSFTKGKDLEKYLRKYESSFEYVEYVPKETLEHYTPNDYFSNPNLLWHIDAVGLRDAWEIMRAKGIINKTKIAIIDNGFDADHEDLVENIAYMEPGANNDRNHGTIVNGIAGMTTDNNKGYCSVAGLYSKLYCYYYGFGYDDIRDATDRGCRVINMSYSHSKPRETYIDAINYAHSKGVLLVAAGASKHEWDLITDYSYPACYDHVIAVAALAQTGVKFRGSKYYDKMDISAPGELITSTDSSNRYGFEHCASSCASPIVAGVASLLFAINPEFSTTCVEQILKASANDDILDLPGNALYKNGLGTGLVDAKAAVEHAFSLIEPLYISANWWGTRHNYRIIVNNCTPGGSVYLHTKSLTINGPFYMGTGKNLVIKPDFVINCQ